LQIPTINPGSRWSQVQTLISKKRQRKKEKGKRNECAEDRLMPFVVVKLDFTEGRSDMWWTF
jgi:hypothetical protein